jgi:hypothetical protein
MSEDNVKTVNISEESHTAAKKIISGRHGLYTIRQVVEYAIAMLPEVIKQQDKIQEEIN